MLRKINFELCKLAIGVTFALTVALVGCASDPNARLLEAVKNWEIQDARAALDAGADPNLVASPEMDPSQSPLLVSAIRNRPTLALLLLERGADINRADKQGETPLAAALSNNQAPESLIREILKRCPKLDASTHFGARELMEAADSKWEFAILALLARGADFKVRDNDGRDALFHAASRGHLRAVKALIQKGLNPLRRDNFGENAIQYARRYHQLQVAQYLFSVRRSKGGSRPATR